MRFSAATISRDTTFRSFALVPRSSPLRCRRTSGVKAGDDHYNVIANREEKLVGKPTEKAARHISVEDSKRHRRATDCVFSRSRFVKELQTQAGPLTFIRGEDGIDFGRRLRPVDEIDHELRRRRRS